MGRQLTDDATADDARPVPPVRPLGERLAVVAERLRRRHLAVYAWAAGSEPVLRRAEELRHSWGQRFDRDESGRPPAAGVGFFSPRKGGPRATAGDVPTADGASERPEAAVPVDVRARLHEVAGDGADHMRLLTDAVADSTARAQHADAVTVGYDVHLRSGRYRPDTPEGFALLAHEASHVTTLLSGEAGRRRTAEGPAAEERAAVEVEALARVWPVPQTVGRSRSGGGLAASGAAPPVRSAAFAAPAGGSAGTAAGPGATAAAGVTTPMRADPDRQLPTWPATSFDVEALRRSLIDDLMVRLRTDAERGG